MTLDMLEAYMKLTRYEREPPTRQDEISADMRETVLKLLVVARAAKEIDSTARLYEYAVGHIPRNEMDALAEALAALES